MKNKFKKWIRSFKKKAFFRAYFLVLIMLYIWPWVFPNHIAYAYSVDTGTLNKEAIETVLKDIPPPDMIMTVTATGYSSTFDQTDDTPFITANGTRVRWGIVATNLFPFNSRVRIKSEFGDEIFIVTDRMHPRFSNRIDIWFPTREEALAFGKQRILVEVWRY